MVTIQTKATRSWIHVLVTRPYCFSRSCMVRNDKLRNIDFILSSVRSYLCFLMELKWINHVKGRSAGEQRDYRRQNLLVGYWKTREASDRRQWWDGSRKKEWDITEPTEISEISKALSWGKRKEMELLALHTHTQFIIFIRQIQWYTLNILFWPIIAIVSWIFWQLQIGWLDSLNSTIWVAWRW